MKPWPRPCRWSFIRRSGWWLPFLGTLSQTGVLFAVKAAMPKLENLDPKKWFQKVFSMKNLFELVKNLIKVGVLGGVVFFILRKYLPMLFGVPQSGIGSLWTVTGEAVNDLVITAAGAFCVIAALDYLYQRYKYNQNHRASANSFTRKCWLRTPWTM